MVCSGAGPGEGDLVRQAPQARAETVAVVMVAGDREDRAGDRSEKIPRDGIFLGRAMFGEVAREDRKVRGEARGCARAMANLVCVSRTDW